MMSGIGLLWMWLAANSEHNPRTIRTPMKGSKCVSTGCMVASFIKLFSVLPFVLVNEMVDFRIRI